MQGANHSLYKELAEQFPMDIIASGGVSTLEDIRKLSALGIYGAIVGKAYYMKAFTIKEALEAAV